MLDIGSIVKGEMLDKYVDYDGMSVQVDLEQLDTGQQRYRVSVYFSADGDEWPEWDDFDTLDHALQWMGPMLYTVRATGCWQRVDE